MKSESSRQGVGLSYGFKEELLNAQKQKALTENLFKKVEKMARALTYHSDPPSLYGLEQERWDSEAVHDLAVDFVTEHLIAGARMRYIKQRAEEGQCIDGLMVVVFKQFMAELKRRRFPWASSLHKRALKILEELEEENKIARCPNAIGGWVEVASSSRGQPRALELEDLRELVQNLPPWKRWSYLEGERREPGLNNEDLRTIILSIFHQAQGCISETVLVQFLMDCLYLSDATFESLDDPSAFERANGLWAARDSSPESVASAREKFSKLTPRQRYIFEAEHIRGLSIPDICAELGLSKTVVYDERKEIERKLRE